MNRVDFLISPIGPSDHLRQRRHYIDHLAPIWHGMPKGSRGDFLCLDDLRAYAEGKEIKPLSFPGERAMLDHISKVKRITVVAGHMDPMFTDRANRPNVILMHGVGFVVDGDHRHPSYPGTRQNRANTLLMLATNERVAALERKANPQIRVEAVGCPKLDKWIAHKPSRNLGSPPIVALAWHWDCPTGDETQSLYDLFEPFLWTLTGRYTVLGHGHPHIIDQLVPRYRSMGIEAVYDFEEVFERADVLIGDATSAVFEFAALDRPVVPLASKEYRSTDCGGCFHLRTSLGPIIESGPCLVDGVEAALNMPPDEIETRRSTIAQCYANLDGSATKAAVDAICNVVNSRT